MNNILTNLEDKLFGLQSKIVSKNNNLNADYVLIPVYAGSTTNMLKRECSAIPCAYADSSVKKDIKRECSAIPCAYVPD